MKASEANIKSDDGECECEQNGTKIVTVICYLNIFHHCLSRVDTRPYYDFNRPITPKSFALCAALDLCRALEQRTKIQFHFSRSLRTSFNELKKMSADLMIHLMMVIYIREHKRFVLWGYDAIEW